MQYQQKLFRFLRQIITIIVLYTLVRFNVYCRIKPHAPPFIQTPANLFKFRLCSLTPQARHLRVSLYNKKDLCIMSINSGHELLGSPILIDIRALEARRQDISEKPPRPQKILTTFSNFISKLCLLLTPLFLKY